MAAVDISGADAKAFLQKTITNNLDKLKNNGQALYTSMLNEAGGIIDDLIVYRFDPNYRIVINAGTAANDLIWLNKVASQFKEVRLTPRRADLPNAQNPQGMIAVQGPQALSIIAKAIPELQNHCSSLKNFHGAIANTNHGEIMIARTGYTGEDGAELLIPQNEAAKIWNLLVEAGAKPAGLGARDTLRLEAGMNLYGQDMNDTTSPLDCGLSWTVDLNKTDFIGKSALLSEGQKYNFLGLILKDKGILRAHQIVKTSHGDGEITSGTFSPSLQQSIAFAKLPLATQIGDEVSVIIRDKALTAVVCKPTFVRQGKALI
jgi:aminomethyltransferase